jgi:ABC-type molybdenum transport system, ATPase component/photorepair protein PhrA
VENVNIIEIKNIKSYIGDTNVFSDFSITIPEGCNTAILGPNGSGKTTFLKLITKELFPVFNEESHIKVFGKERWNIWELRSQLGLVSHDLQKFIYDDASGVNVILSGLFSSPDVWFYQKVTKEQKNKAEEIMSFLGIADLAERDFAKMSTGQQRKFLLGRALINEPKVLILDEPTSGLDIKACFQYIEIIRNLMNRGKTIILVTHHIHEIPPEIKRVVLLKKGELFLDGNKEEILTEANIINLFDVSLQLVKIDGFYQVLPVDKK